MLVLSMFTTACTEIEDQLLTDAFAPAAQYPLPINQQQVHKHQQGNISELLDTDAAGNAQNDSLAGAFDLVVQPPLTIGEQLQRLNKQINDPDLSQEGYSNVMDKLLKLENSADVPDYLRGDLENLRSLSLEKEPEPELVLETPSGPSFGIATYA